MREVQKDGKPYGTEGREASETVSRGFETEAPCSARGAPETGHPRGATGLGSLEHRPRESGDAPQALSIWARWRRPLKST